MSIRIGILGYGNLGRGVEAAIAHNPDMELVGVFTRRDPASVKIATAGVSVYHTDDAEKMQDQIDVMIICGGSATDLPKMTPKYAAMFNVVDSFDTHAHIPEHFAAVDAAAKKAGKIGLISCGWDPGMFSLNRVYANAILPDGKDYTFWGRGVSQGHSDAIRRIEGVKDARQYTCPVEAAVESVRAGENPELTPVSATLLPRRAQTWPALSARSRPCQTILTSMTPPCTSSLRKNCSATMLACRMAVSSSARARPATARTSISLSTASSWTPIRSSPARSSPPARVRLTA